VAEGRKHQCHFDRLKDMSEDSSKLLEFVSSMHLLTDSSQQQQQQHQQQQQQRTTTTK